MYCLLQNTLSWLEESLSDDIFCIMKLDIEPLNDRNLMKQLQQMANKSVVSVLLLPAAGVNRVLSAAGEYDSDLNSEIINKLIQRNAAKQAVSLCINPVCFYS